MNLLPLKKMAKGTEVYDPLLVELGKTHDAAAILFRHPGDSNGEGQGQHANCAMVHTTIHTEEGERELSREKHPVKKKFFWMKVYELEDPAHGPPYKMTRRQQSS